MSPAESIRSAPTCSHGIFYPHMRHSTFFRKVQQLHKILIKSWDVGERGKVGDIALRQVGLSRRGMGLLALPPLLAVRCDAYGAFSTAPADQQLLTCCSCSSVTGTGHWQGLKWTRSCTGLWVAIADAVALAGNSAAPAGSTAGSLRSSKRCCRWLWREKADCCDDELEEDA